MIEPRIASHLEWIASMDPAYAKWARGNYIAMIVTPFRRKA